MSVLGGLSQQPLHTLSPDQYGSELEQFVNTDVHPSWEALTWRSLLSFF